MLFLSENWIAIKSFLFLDVELLKKRTMNRILKIMERIQLSDVWTIDDYALFGYHRSYIHLHTKTRTSSQKIRNEFMTNVTQFELFVISTISQRCFALDQIDVYIQNCSFDIINNYSFTGNFDIVIKMDKCNTVYRQNKIVRYYNQIMSTRPSDTLTVVS